MRNDTNGPEDHSQAPFISSGNEGADASVAEDMMDHNDTAPTIDDPAAPTPVDRTEDTGEMEALPPIVQPSVVEPTPFDYDTYYADEALWAAASPAPEPTVDAPQRTRRDGAMFFVGALAAAVVGAALTVGILAATGTLTQDEVTTTTVAAVSAGTPAPEPTETITNTIINNDLGSAVNPAAVAQKAVPSIVTVETFNGEGSSASGLGSGSGVVLTEDGYIATNEHVVEGASRWTVTFEDGRIYEADLIGMDELTDLAVLKISGDGLVPIDLGSADALVLGDPAIAVGNPLGQDGGSSISVGIVSAFDRRVDFSDGSTLFGMIQTDAAINQGSSGGALVNADGELIGITSAIGVSNAGPEGIGYAIPVELVQRITDEIIETGDVAHTFLGVTVQTFLEEQPDGAIQPVGAEIGEITGSDSAAGAAGLEVGDVVVQIGDEPISTLNDLILAVRLYRVGDAVPFTVVRDGEAFTVDVIMGQRPAEFGG